MNSTIATNTVSRYANRGMNLLIGFLLTPFLLDRLGAEMMGLQVIAVQSIQFCIILGTACSRGYTRFATVHHARGNASEVSRTLGQGLTLTVPLIVLAMAVIVGLAASAPFTLQLRGDLLDAGRVVILVVGVGYVFNQVTCVWESLLLMTQRIYVLQVEQIVSRVLSAITIIAVFHFCRPSVVTWVIITALSTMVVKALYVLPAASRAVPDVTVRFGKPEGQEFKRLLLFGGASLLGSLGFYLHYATSPVIIANIHELGVSKVMVYNLGQRWDGQIREVALALALAMTPVFTHLHARKDSVGMKAAFLSSLRYALLASLLPVVLLFVYSGSLIHLWVGQEYAAEAGDVLKLAMLNVLASVPYIVGYEVLVGVGRISRASWVMVGGGVANIVLAVVFAVIFKLGLAGVALSMLLTHGVLISTYVLTAVRKELDLRWSEMAGAIFRCLLNACPVILLATVLSLMYPPSSWVALLAQCAACGLVHAAMIYRYGISRDERAKLLGYLSRKKRRSDAG